MNARLRIIFTVTIGTSLLLILLLVLARSPETTMAQPAQPHDTESLMKQMGGRSRAIAKQGDYVYLGIGSRLDVIDVQDPTNPIQVGQTEPLTKTFFSLHMIGDLAIAPVSYNLYIFDLSNPQSPTLTQTYPISSVMVNDFVISGTVAFVSENKNFGVLTGGGMRILDISDPLHPTEISLSLGGHTVYSVAVYGNYAYIGYCETIDSSSCALRSAIWDISDLSSPFELSHDNHGIVSQAVYGNYLYRLGYDGYFDIYELSDPTNPVWVGDLDQISFKKIKIINDQAILMYYSGFCIYDLLPDPANPTQFGCIYEGADVTIDNSELFIASGDNGLRIADATQASLPEIGSLYTFGWVTDAAQVDGYAYVLDTSLGLHILDVANPIEPIEVSSYDSGSNSEMIVDGDDLFLGGRYEIEILDVTNPISPSLRATYTPSEASARIIVEGDYAYLLIEDWQHDSLEVVDISDRDNPTYIASAGQMGNTGEDMVIAGDYAYISEYSGSSNVLTIIDISTPTAPQIVATQPISYDPGPVVYLNDHIFMGNYGVQIIDVTNPQIPQPAGRLTVTGAADFGYDVAAVDGLLYVTAENDQGDPIKLKFDVTNPAAPVELGPFEYTKGLQLFDSNYQYTYVPAADDGLLIYGRFFASEYVYLPLIVRNP